MTGSNRGKNRSSERGLQNVLSSSSSRYLEAARRSVLCKGHRFAASNGEKQKKTESCESGDASSSERGSAPSQTAEEDLKNKQADETAPTGAIFCVFIVDMTLHRFEMMYKSVTELRMAQTR